MKISCQKPRATPGIRFGNKQFRWNRGQEVFMHCGARLFSSLLLGSALILPLATSSCSHHYYTSPDYTVQEDVYYNQWVTETHRDPHVDYHHLRKEDQKRYWDWRHSHEHDHDKDHDQNHQ
jgi:hypothetical protein